ncbi:MAG: hypothetical protein WB868_20650 [Xanthobacteraceae bacterium]
MNLLGDDNAVGHDPPHQILIRAKGRQSDCESIVDAFPSDHCRFRIAGRQLGITGSHGSLRLLDELCVERGLLLCLILGLAAWRDRAAGEREAKNE